MENFSNLFTTLKQERGLSNKQIASFTGATLKEVRRWESGVGVPTEKRIIAALEGILGKDISKGLKNLTDNQASKKETLVEDSLFSIERTKEIKTSSKFLNRFRREKEKKKRNTQTEIYTYENLLEAEELTQEEVNKSELVYEDLLQEQPYINDPKQLGFYFSRNIKTTIWLIFLIYFSIQGFELFWDSIKGLINNLL